MASKIVKPANQEADDFEKSIAAALVDLEANVQELKTDLREVYITSAKEVDISSGKKAIVVFVPPPLLQAMHRVQVRVVRELEKKFSGKHVIVLAQRRILKKETRKTRCTQPRPRSRTLTHVHDAILEDLVYPTEIVGKRTRVKTDGSKIVKVHLDMKDQKEVEYKLDTFSSVYKRLTGKDVCFEFKTSA
eukprot:CFRG1277T1